jgi:hypothetical protein
MVGTGVPLSQGSLARRVVSSKFFIDFYSLFHFLTSPITIQGGDDSGLRLTHSAQCHDGAPRTWLQYDECTIQAQVTSFSVMFSNVYGGSYVHCAWKLLSWTFGGGYSLLIFKKDLARVTACRTLPFGGRAHTSRERAHGF